MKKSIRGTQMKVYQENVRTGAKTPYVCTEVASSVKTSELANDI